MGLFPCDLASMVWYPGREKMEQMEQALSLSLSRGKRILLIFQEKCSIPKAEIWST